MVCFACAYALSACASTVIGAAVSANPATTLRLVMEVERTCAIGYVLGVRVHCRPSAYAPGNNPTCQWVRRHARSVSSTHSYCPLDGIELERFPQKANPDNSADSNERWRQKNRPLKPANNVGMFRALLTQARISLQEVSIDMSLFDKP